MAIDKLVNVTLKGKDELTPTVKKASNAIESHLIKSINSSNLSMRAKEKAIKAVNVQAQQNIFMVNTISGGNVQLAKSLQKSTDAFEKIYSATQIVHKGIQAVGQGFIFLVGKERAFEMISTASENLSQILEKVIKQVAKMGGPFAKLVPILGFVRDMLQSNIAAFSVFSLIGAENVEAADNIRDSLIGLGVAETTLTQKLKIAAIAMNRYGDIMLDSNGIMAKLKGVALKTGAAIASMGAMVSGTFGEIAKESALAGAAILAIVGIDKIYIPLIKTIDSLVDSLVASRLSLVATEEFFNKNWKITQSWQKSALKITKTFRKMFSVLGAGIRQSSFSFKDLFGNISKFESEIKSRMKNVVGATQKGASVIKDFGGSVGAMRTRVLTLRQARIEKILQPGLMVVAQFRANVLNAVDAIDDFARASLSLNKVNIKSFFFSATNQARLLWFVLGQDIQAVKKMAGAFLALSKTNIGSFFFSAANEARLLLFVMGQDIQAAKKMASALKSISKIKINAAFDSTSKSVKSLIPGLKNINLAMADTAALSKIPADTLKRAKDIAAGIHPELKHINLAMADTAALSKIPAETLKRVKDIARGIHPELKNINLAMADTAALSKIPAETLKRVQTIAFGTTKEVKNLVRQLDLTGEAAQYPADVMKNLRLRAIGVDETIKKVRLSFAQIAKVKLDNVFAQLALQSNVAFDSIKNSTKSLMKAIAPLGQVFAGNMVDSFKTVLFHGEETAQGLIQSFQAAYLGAVDPNLTQALLDRTNLYANLFLERMMATFSSFSKMVFELVNMPLRAVGLDMAKLIPFVDSLKGSFSRFLTVGKETSTVMAGVKYSLQIMTQAAMNASTWVGFHLAQAFKEFALHVVAFKAINITRVLRNLAKETVLLGKHLGLAAINFRNTNEVMKNLSRSGKVLKTMFGTLKAGVVIMGGTVQHLVHTFELLLRASSGLIGMGSNYMGMLEGVEVRYTKLRFAVAKASEAMLIRMNLLGLMLDDMATSFFFAGKSAGSMHIRFSTFMKLRIAEYFGKIKQAMTSTIQVMKDLVSGSLSMEQAMSGLGSKIAKAGVQFKDFAVLSLGKVQAGIYQLIPSLKIFGNSVSAVMGKAALDASVFGKAFLESTDDVNTMLGFLQNKSREAFLRFKIFMTDGAIHGLKNLKGTLEATKASLTLFIEQTRIGAAISGGLGKSVIELVKHSELFEKGLGATVAKMGIFNSAFGAIGLNMARSDKAMTKMTGYTLVALSAALGGTVFIVQQLIISMGGLISKMGTGLTNSSLRQIELFGKTQDKAFAFSQTIKGMTHNTAEAIKVTEKWNKFISTTAKATGTTTASLQALAAETIQATHSMHLNDQQMQTLISRSIDLSEQAHKPAIETLTALINGLNGSSQGLVAYGISANEAHIKTSGLTEEVKKNFKSLTDVQKAQARYQVLMEQANRSSGFAIDNAFTYSKGLKLQKNAQKELNAELGRGAEIINGQVVFGLAKATQAFTNFAAPILPTIGFLQALAGRVLSLTGFLVTHTLTISLLVSAYGGLQKMLGTLAIKETLTQPLWVGGKSVTQLIKGTGALTVDLRSLGGVAKTSLSVVAAQLRKTARSMVGLNENTKLTMKTFRMGMARSTRSMLGMNKTAKLTAGTLATRLWQAVVSVTVAMLGLEKGTKLTARAMITQLATGFRVAAAAAGQFLIAILPIAIKIALVVAAFYLLKNALMLVEKETKIFSSTWAKMVAWWEEANPVVEMVKKSFHAFSGLLSQVVVVAVQATAAVMTHLLAMISLLTLGMMAMTRVFSFILPDSLVASNESLKAMTEQVLMLEAAAFKMGGDALGGFVDILFGTAHAADMAGHSYKKLEHEIEVLSAAYVAIRKTGREAFDYASDLAPALALKQMKVEAKAAALEITKMTDQAELLKKTIFALTEAPPKVPKLEFDILPKTGGPLRPEELVDLAALQAAVGKSLHPKNPLTPSQLMDLGKLQEDIRDAELAQKAIKIKIAQEERAAKIAEVEIQLEQTYQKTFSVEQEIKTMRLDSARDIRDQLVSIETERILATRNLQGQQVGTVDQEALVAANQVEMDLYRANLELKRQLSVDMETQKQIQIAQVKAAALGGSGGGADAKQDVEILQATHKANELERLRQEDKISQKEHLMALNQIEFDLTTQGIENQRLLHQQKAEALGLTEAGLAERMSMVNAEHQMTLEKIRLHEENKTMTQEQASMARDDSEQQRLANLNAIQQQHTQSEIKRHETLGNSWQATLGRMRLSQQKHGKILGTIRAVQASQEFQAVQGALGNLASLRNSKSKKMFQIGKTAAIAQAMVNTFMGATSAFAALAPIPFVGPALGFAAAAAAIAAGVVNVQNIKSQKFSGGQAHAGMDNIPQSMNNKSFIVAGGERIVQPEANKDLTGFLQNQTEGGGKNITVNITVQGAANSETVEEIKRAVIDGIREASERGEPIINEKGIVSA